MRRLHRKGGGACASCAQAGEVVPRVYLQNSVRPPLPPFLDFAVGRSYNRAEVSTPDTGELIFMNARFAAVTTAVALLALLMAAGSAFAQWGPQQQDLGMAVSWAYSGNDTGYRLELGQRDFVIDAGFFNADNYGPRGDGDVYALELGVGPSALMEGYEGAPFVLGVGGYNFSADDPEQGDNTSFSLWAGAGDFEHSSKGLFYQYRYIFDGPIAGSQGILGWAF